MDVQPSLLLFFTETPAVCDGHRPVHEGLKDRRQK